MNAFPDKPDPEPIGPDAERGTGSAARESGEQASVPLVTALPLSGEFGSTSQGLLTSPTVFERPRDPAWNALDLVRLTLLALVALFFGIFAVLLIARFWIYPHSSLSELARIPLLVVAGQALSYLLVLCYMYILVTRERRRPDFLAAIHWNWPAYPAVYVFVGVMLSVALQILASRLPIPKNLPIDTFFRTPAETWVLTIFGVTLAPVMEELFFRGFLYPVLARGIGLPAAVLFTAVAFALLHASQLSNSWGPVLVIFLVGMVLTMVRARTNSVSAGLLIHVAYNGTISALMFFATDGFRHLEKLNQ